MTVAKAVAAGISAAITSSEAGGFSGETGLICNSFAYDRKCFWVLQILPE